MISREIGDRAPIPTCGSVTYRDIATAHLEICVEWIVEAMSIFHFLAKAITRTKDANSVHKAVYDSRSYIVDLNKGRSY